MSSSLFLIVITLFFKSVTNNLVTTHSGKINGKYVHQNGKLVRAYLGIPYAQPPLKHLRFKKPKPVDPWEITLQAKSLPPGCVQFSSEPYPWVDNLPGLSEDCLYLNIWTPPVDSNRLKKKAVMFWIHGGGFKLGSSRIDLYHGEVLAAKGNVIMESCNYRLAAEGFFYSGDMEDAPGNMGMWDIVEALKWVRNNIECFGGDKDLITLFGESAGATAVGLLSTSHVTKGMFKYAILESGSSVLVNEGEENDPLLVSQKIAEAVGCASQEDTLSQCPKPVVECMRNSDAFEIAKILQNMTSGNLRTYYPRFGDDLLPNNPRKCLINGDFHPTNLLIGTNSGEGGTIALIMQNIFGAFGEENPQINLTSGESMIREAFKNYPDPDAVVRQYLGHLQENDTDQIRFQVMSSFGDYTILCPSVYLAESFAKKGAQVYYYFFTHIPSNSPWAPWMLSMHSSEIQFVFGLPLRYPQNYTLEEQELSTRMIYAWSTFAKTGKPAREIWPLYSKEIPVYQVLDVDNAYLIGYGPHRQNCDFFRSDLGF